VPKRFVNGLFDADVTAIYGTTPHMLVTLTSFTALQPNPAVFLQTCSREILAPFGGFPNEQKRLRSNQAYTRE
jgi:hypothetical protein